MIRKMGNRPLTSRKDRTGTFLSCLLVFSCLYKIAVVKDGMLQRVLTPIANALPYSGIGRYTNSIMIVKIFLVGLSLHVICIVYWLFQERGKIRITRSVTEECLLLMFVIRMISEFWVHKGLSTYSIIYDLLCIFFVLVFYQIRPDKEELHCIQESLACCVYRIGLLCAVFAIANFVIGLTQSISTFEFREYRIPGFLFDSILAGGIYGLGLISAINLHSRCKMKSMKLVMVAAVLAVGCLLTGSRSALYFLAIACFYFVGSKKKFSKYLYIGLFVVIAVVLYSNILAEQDISFVSDGARAYKYKLAFDVFVNHPVAGVGTNMFHLYDTVYGSNPHNLPLTLLAENGIIGFIPWFIWFIKSVINAVKTKEQYWRWMMISYMILSMILGTLTNTITVIIMVMVTWACEVSEESGNGEEA